MKIRIFHVFVLVSKEFLPPSQCTWQCLCTHRGDESWNGRSLVFYFISKGAIGNKYSPCTANSPTDESNHLEPSVDGHDKRTPTVALIQWWLETSSCPFKAVGVFLPDSCLFLHFHSRRIGNFPGRFSPSFPQPRTMTDTFRLKSPGLSPPVENYGLRF